MKSIYEVQRQVNECKRCGIDYGNSACGFGQPDPEWFLIGINPWVRDHEFNDGRGLTILKKKFAEWGFTNFFLDNVVKCQMPGDFKPVKHHARKCMPYLKDQYAVLKPKKLLIFGKFAAESLHYEWRSWTEQVNKVWGLAYIVPHFSAPVHNPEAFPGYYEKLKGVLDGKK